MKTIAAVTFLAAVAGFTANARADNSRVNITLGANYSAPAFYSAPRYVEMPRYVEAPRGHWEDVTRRDWIPARWVESRDRWGRPVRVLEQGRYELRNERVWVDGGRREPVNYGFTYRNDHDRDDRRVWNR